MLLGPQLFPDDILLIRDGRNVLRLGGDTGAALSRPICFFT